MRSWLRQHWLWIALPAWLALHLALAALPPLNGDEAFYWNWARHLDWSYPSHPPLTAWSIALVTALPGATTFTVRLTALLWHVGTLWLVYRMAAQLGGGPRQARRAVAIAAAFPALFLLGAIMTTDSPVIFFWTATAYLTQRAIVERRRRYWYLAGLTAGGMLLTKFFAGLFPLAPLLFLLLHRRHRGELLRPEPYAGLLIAAALFTPVLFWNASHEWLTFRFNFQARHQVERLDALNVGYYLAGQLLAASPVLGAGLLAALARALGLGWRGGDGGGDGGRDGGGASARARDGLSFYAWTVAVPLAVYLLQSPFLHVGAHWAAMVYPTAAVVLAAWLFPGEAGLEPGRPARRRWHAWGLAGAGAFVLPLAALALAPQWVLPARQLYLDPQAPAPKWATDYFGWREAGEHIARLREEGSRRPEGFFLSTSDYSIASVLEFYTPGRADFVLVAYQPDEYHGKEYLLWARGRTPVGAATVYVSDRPPRADRPHPIAPYFERVEPLPPLEVRDARGLLRVFYFTAGYGYKGNARHEFRP